jgi:hypothetical protein
LTTNLLCLSPFQNFKSSRLTLKLHDDTSPLDAMLESVMPGMHKRLVVMERGTTRLVDQHLREGLFNLGMMVKEGFDDMIGECESTAVKLAAFHSVMTASLGTTSKKKGTSYDVVSKKSKDVLSSNAARWSPPHPGCFTAQACHEASFPAHPI